MTVAIQEQQLGQLRPSGTSPESIYSPAAGVTWVAKSITLCNTTGATALASLYHHEGGTTYTADTQILNEVELLAKETRTLTILLAGKASIGNVAVQSSVAGAINYSLYGAEITNE